MKKKLFESMEQSKFGGENNVRVICFLKFNSITHIYQSYKVKIMLKLLSVGEKLFIELHQSARNVGRPVTIRFSSLEGFSTVEDTVIFFPIAKPLAAVKT